MAIYMREDLIQKNEKEDNVKNSNNINHDVVTKPNVVHGQQLKQDSKQQRNKGGAYGPREEIYMRENLNQKYKQKNNVKNSNNINDGEVNGELENTISRKPNVVRGQKLKQDSKQQRNKGGAYKTRKGTSLNGAINYLSMPEENYHDIL
jgi:hypothetical protein